MREKDFLALDLETALRELLDQFEPTSPGSILVQTPDGGVGYFPITEDCEQAILNAEFVLGQVDEIGMDVD